MQNVGIENLYIEHINVKTSSDYTQGGTNDVFNIVFRFAENCFINNVYSYNATRGHVIFEYSYNVSIVNSYFGYAVNYGVG